ncbi:MAG: phospho-sugar mutase [Bacilli bacterium]|jgi:phosphoglucomutase|nr:phospho-sugar mutase [Bacilli bacterium]
MKDYPRWLRRVKDETLHKELLSMGEAEKGDAFYKDLEFGTGGLRGLLGAGSNRLNVYTVGRISQGLASYVNAHFKDPSIAISYDSRINSRLFAETAASVFAANGIKAYLYDRLMPTPCLSYAVRYLRSAAGVMVTASHNPKEYNGYKVYEGHGCQITLEMAKEIGRAIEETDVFDGVRSLPFPEGLEKGLIAYIPQGCYESYMRYIMGKDIPEIQPRDLRIVYSPLNGTGRVPVLDALRKAGFANVFPVREQALPDGSFPTCPKPNPELREALALGIRDLRDKKGDLLLVTDPDCDRLGTAFLIDGEPCLLSGNEIGILLCDFLLRHKRHDAESVLVKTIVTTDMVIQMAEDNGMKVVETLTGFKFIGEEIGRLEREGHPERFFMGFEESYGYLTGTEVRDKDAVDAALNVALMFQSYRNGGKSPLARLDELYRKYGYYENALDSYEFEGESGFGKMRGLMDRVRAYGEAHLGDFAFVDDCLAGTHKGTDGERKLALPSSDVMKFGFKDGATVTIRPSGTEPKLKVYYSVRGSRKEGLEASLRDKRSFVASFMGS